MLAEMWGSLDELLELLFQCFLAYYVCLLWLIMLVVHALDYFAGVDGSVGVTGSIGM